MGTYPVYRLKLWSTVARSLLEQTLPTWGESDENQDGDQALSFSLLIQVGFLNNWFAWNPQARTFTLCLCVLPAVEGQTAGILSLSCDFVVSDVSSLRPCEIK